MMNEGMIEENSASRFLLSKKDKSNNITRNSVSILSSSSPQNPSKINTSLILSKRSTTHKTEDNPVNSYTNNLNNSLNFNVFPIKYQQSPIVKSQLVANSKYYEKL